MYNKFVKFSLFAICCQIVRFSRTPRVIPPQQQRLGRRHYIWWQWWDILIVFASDSWTLICAKMANLDDSEVVIRHQSDREAVIADNGDVWGIDASW